MNSVGPRALGMGGAFIGLADDASAIYWNPASLTQQESSFKMILTDVMPINHYKADGTDFGYPAQALNIKADGVLTHYFNPNIFLNYKKDKFAFAFGVYVPAGLGAKYNGKDLAGLCSGASNADKIDWESKIGVVNTSPTIAYQFNDKLSIGVALNIYYGMFELKRLGRVADINGDNVNEAFQYKEDSAGLGYSGTFSLKYQINT